MWLRYLAGAALVDVPNDPGLAGAIRASAERLGINPVDLGTAISYETGGKLSPDVWGGSKGKYLGLIQFSPENQERYGVKPGMTAAEQMPAVEQYLKDRGVKPGHGLLDVYSAINAGRVGRYNASDTAAGGAPGTVADKVASMAPHRVRAELLLNGKLPAGYGQPAASAAVASAAPASAPLGLAPDTPDAGDEQFGALLEMAKRFAASAHEDNALPDALPPLRVLDPMVPLTDRRRMRGSFA